MKRSISCWLILTPLLFSVFVGLSVSTQSSAADRSAVEDFVTRFYQTCLDRAPDQAGLDGWVSGLVDGSLTGSDVAYGFVFSQEFLNKNTNNEEYLAVLYEAFFNRQPDAGGLQGWLDAIARGASREDVLDGFIFAAEFVALCEEYGIKAFEGHIPKAQREAVKAFVTRFYQLCLDRDPDTAGLEGWTNNLLNQIQTGADVAEGFIYSEEFINKNTSNDEYLTILYKAFFNRLPDPTGWDTWLAELNSGRDRGEVLNGFIYSQEFAALCDEFGIKAFSDNTKIFGRYTMNASVGSCSESLDATVGDDFSKRVEEGYLYLPAIGSPSPYSYYDVGDYITVSITLSENRMTMREDGLRDDGSGWVTILHVDFAADYNSFTLSGSATDDDPSECQGAISGSGGRL